VHSRSRGWWREKCLVGEEVSQGLAKSLEGLFDGCFIRSKGGSEIVGAVSDVVRQMARLAGLETCWQSVLDREEASW
jgi:hypothetical protein